MSDADFRIIPPIAITGAGSFSRPSSATYWDRNGVLQTAAANEFRITYDPADLGKAPAPLVEPAATNNIRNNTMQGAATGTPGATPTNWGVEGSGVNGLTRTVLQVGTEDGIEFVDIRYAGVATASGTHQCGFDTTTAVTAATGETWAGSVFVTCVGTPVGVINPRMQISERTDAGGQVAVGEVAVPLEQKRLAAARVGLVHTLAQPGVGRVSNKIIFSYSSGSTVDVTLRIGLPQLERDRITSPIKTSGTAATRAADVVGSAAGLLHCNVPETEPLWAPGTYAKGVRVRDSKHVVWESLVASNTAVLDDETKWYRVGATTRYKMFDKAVNSRTVAPDLVTFTLTSPGVANTMMLLNLAGTRVTIAQADSGYTRTKSLVRHEVSNWYDFYYQEPIRAGDAVFEDIPPYPGSPITVTVDSPGAEAGIGAVLLSKAITVGTTQWELTAGVLSYSTSTTDGEGSITMKKRPNARRMNFEVALRRGFEVEAYRILTDYTDVEIGVIAAKQYEMTYGYGFLGQWEVPLSIQGKKASIEFRGLT